MTDQDAVNIANAVIDAGYANIQSRDDFFTTARLLEEQRGLEEPTEDTLEDAWVVYQSILDT